MRVPLTIQIASLPDRDDVVAEIWAGKDQLAEVRAQGNAVRVILFPSPGEGSWDLSLDDLVESLRIANARLSQRD
jgi:hypothetical protein